mmetsp:Transcript_38071/g.77470  ORF Transcript_38071/g.77470 Transcript_38071/m.77470 type:complete len:196 (-) Transcript_38071:1939-2526(-)
MNRKRRQDHLTMHRFGPLIATFLFAAPNSNNSERWINSLSTAKDISNEAADKVKAGRHREAAQLYEDAMLFGRKAALNLHEGGDDDGAALDWLIGLYRNSADVRLLLDDVEGARRDAWGACVFSQNEDIPSLDCLANVCKAGGDDIGQMQALKRILELDERKDTGSISDIEGTSMKEIQSTIAALDEKIKKKVGW